MLRQHRLYKSVWHWSEDENKLSVFGSTDKEKSKTGGIPAMGSSIKLDRKDKKTGAFYFTDNIDQNQQMIFRQRYQRGVKPHIPNVVTMQDIKDVVMFLGNGHIPTCFIELYCSMEINLLLRCVILYIQLYLKIWEDLEYRSNSYKHQRLKHPISIERETLCKKNLSKLRGRIGQEYALIISGEYNYKKFHHMNNTLNRSYTNQDVMLYDYLSKFITKTVWVALNRINMKEIETEINRLFHFKDVSRGKNKCMSSEHEADEKILQGENILYLSKWHKNSPVIADIFTNQEIPDAHVENESSGSKSEKTVLTGLEAALTLPEELLDRAGVTVGILGQPRDNFEPLLTVRQKQKSTEDEELEKMLAAMAEEVKPKVKMYEYLGELDALVDLNVKDESSSDEWNPPDEGETLDIIEEMNLYHRSHLEDSNKSFKLWMLRQDGLRNAC